MVFIIRFFLYAMLLTAGVFASMAVSHLELPFPSSVLWFFSTFLIGGGLALVGKNCGRGGLFIAIPLSVLSAHALVGQIWPPEIHQNIFRAFHQVAKRDMNYKHLRQQLTPVARKTLVVPDRFKRGPFAEKRELIVARGLKIEVYAAGLVDAHSLAVGQQGELYVSLPNVGRVVALVDNDADGLLDEVKIVAAGLDRPSGLAFWNGQLYVATAQQISRVVDPDHDLLTERVEVFSRDLPEVDSQWAHAMAVGNDGALYVSVGGGDDTGSAQLDWRRASVLRLDAQGRSHPFASGIKQCLGLAVHPKSGSLWASDDSPETLGFDVYPDELNVLTADGDYGWPYCYGERIPDPEIGLHGICQGTRPSLLALPSLSSPRGLVFGHRLHATQPFRSMVFVALHGSHSGKRTQGFRLMGVPLTERGQISGWGIDLISGWSVDGVPWGQPQHVVTGHDGALYLTDPLAGAVYRIRFPEPVSFEAVRDKNAS